MKKISTMKMSAMAVALTLPLALTACGNDNEDSAATETATATSTKTSTSTSATSSEESSTEETTGQNPDGQEPRPEGEQQVPTIQDPIAALSATAKPVKPLEAPAASEADIQQINNLLGGLSQQKSVKGMSIYMLDNSCPATQEAAGGAGIRQQIEAIPDLTLEQTGIASMNVGQATDVKSDGNSATASVTSQIQGPNGTESVTETMYFTKNGNGQWQFCSQQ